MSNPNHIHRGAEQLERVANAAARRDRVAYAVSIIQDALGDQINLLRSYTNGHDSISPISDASAAAGSETYAPAQHQSLAEGAQRLGQEALRDAR